MDEEIRKINEGGIGMNNAKVMVTKEVAEAIEELRKDGISNFHIMRLAYEAVVNPTYLTIRHWSFNGGGGSPDLLIQALVNGYTVEKSPEEKVREYYDRCRNNATIADYNGRSCQAEYLNAQSIGASITLDILGIKIEGVNA